MPPPAPPAGPATVESLGQQLRDVLPTRRLHSVSLCDNEANVLWLSEGALGPDEHVVVLEALEILSADPSLPCHESALEDGRLGVFLPVRSPMGSLVGIAMILADSKTVGDDTLERMTATPVRTIMQRLAVLLKPTGALAAALPDDTEAEEAPEAAESDAEAPEIAEIAETAETAETDESTEPAEAAAPVEPAAPQVALSLVSEAEVQVAVAAVRVPDTDADDDSETIITAAEIASILELVPDDSSPAPTREPPPAATTARAPAKPATRAPALVSNDIADSGMLKLEFLAEPPVVRPAPNPVAVAKKLQAASKAAEVAPTRSPRPLPTPSAARAGAAAPAPAAKGKAVVPAKAPPAKAPASATPASLARNPFEPVAPPARLSLGAKDDVVLLFDSETPGAPPAKAAQPTRIAPAQRITAPARSAPAVRTVPAPASAVAEPHAPVAAMVAAPAVAAEPPALAAAPAAGEPSTAGPPIDLVPFAKLRAGGQTRRFQVQPRPGTSQRDPAAADEQTLQQLLGWLGAHRAQWSGMPTSFTVNLSIATLEDERFAQKIGTALNTHGISGETLGFEIAESLCVQQRAKVERFIAQCEKLGTWIAIDDFTFDSQVLPLLRSKALRLLKLDARLTAAALRDKLSQAMLVATVQAAKVLGIHTSAKKADSPASLQYLAAIGLDYAQGAALSRTIPLDAIGAIEARSNGIPLPENNQ